jgi:hypothetical protein
MRFVRKDWSLRLCLKYGFEAKDLLGENDQLLCTET